MRIETLTHSEAEVVFAREKAGEFRITGMKVGKTNASWLFTVSEPPPQRDLPELDVAEGSAARVVGTLAPGGLGNLLGVSTRYGYDAHPSKNRAQEKNPKNTRL